MAEINYDLQHLKDSAERIKQKRRKERIEELINSKRKLLYNQIGPESHKEIQIEEVPEKKKSKIKRMIIMTTHKRKKNKKSYKKKCWLCKSIYYFEFKILY